MKHVVYKSKQACTCLSRNRATHVLRGLLFTASHRVVGAGLHCGITAAERLSVLLVAASKMLSCQKKKKPYEFLTSFMIRHRMNAFY